MNSSISFYSRARRSDDESTRNDILHAAGQLFAEYGYAGTTNRAICDKAGTNTAAVNY
jgi:AcrR family transcriptional regulator